MAVLELREAANASVHVAPSPPVLVVAVAGVSGGAAATGNVNGSILLNFDNEEPARPNGAGQQPPLPQQTGGWDSRRWDAVGSPWQQMGVSVSVTGYQSAAEASQTITGRLLYHEFAVPQHPGRAAPLSSAGRGSRDGLANLLLLAHPTPRTAPAHQRSHGKEGARIGTGRFCGEGRRGVLPQQDTEAKRRGQAPCPHCPVFTPWTFS